MASLAGFGRVRSGSGDRFFMWSALLMALVIAAGFSMQLAMGRSSFSAPLVVHVHAVVFMGWIGIYVTQTALATTGSLALHRRLGWIGAAWIVAMVVLGLMVTVYVAQAGRVPFIFRPAHFLIANPLTLFAFVGLTVAAIVMRRRNDWHRRLHLGGTALLMGPGFGRLLPMPLLQPYAYEAAMAASLLFPAAGVVADLRSGRRVHPAWWWGIGAALAVALVSGVLGNGAVGTAIYEWVTAGTPGAAVAPQAFAPPPAMPAG
jgi:hypothetical protein